VVDGVCSFVVDGVILADADLRVKVSIDELREDV